MSVVSSFMTKANALLGAMPTPSQAYFGEAAVRGPSGIAVDPPFAVVEEERTAPDYEMEYGGDEVTTLTITCYATTLAEVDAMMEYLKYAGQTPTIHAGLDFGTLANPNTNLRFEECKRTDEKRAREPMMFQSNGNFVHSGKLFYTVLCNITDSSS